MANDQVRVFLWALPRSVSTAFTKCMSFVDGCQVWHEPYQYSLFNKKMKEPEVIMKSKEAGMSLDKFQELTKTVMQDIPKGKAFDDDLFKFQWVKEQLDTFDPDKKVIFVKDMAHVLVDHYEYLPSLLSYRHTFLIRHPKLMWRSLAKFHFQYCHKDVDIFTALPMYDAINIYKNTYDLWKHVKENFDEKALIIEGTEMAKNPEILLPKYFSEVGIPYKKGYLEWPASPDIVQEWKASFSALHMAINFGILKAAVESSKFLTPPPDAMEKTDEVELREGVQQCIEASMPYYEEMHAARITAAS